MPTKVVNPMYEGMPVPIPKGTGMQPERVIERQIRKVHPEGSREAMRAAHGEWGASRQVSQRAWSQARALPQARAYTKAALAEKKAQEARRSYLGAKRAYKREVRRTGRR